MTDRLYALPLFPLLALQGRRFRREVPMLPEPPGERSGSEGSGPILRLLVVGDSGAAGVGASSQREALSGRVVKELACHFAVTWRVLARAGATTSGTIRHLAGASPEEFDVAVVALGFNDVIARRSLRGWLDDVALLVFLLRRLFGVRQIVFSALPPVHLFPAFPQPLRWYLGARTRRFDRALARWTEGRAHCEHLPLPVDSVDGLLATDGLHPGPLLYAKWSAGVVSRVERRWLAQTAMSR